MWTVAIISQKGGVGKSTLAVNLGACAERHGKVAAIVDLDHQASASEWKALRGKDTGPDVVRAPIARLPELLRQAKAGGADLVLVDTAPHTDSSAALAIQSADFVLIPTRAATFDLYAIQNTLAIVGKARTAVVLNGVPPRGTLEDEARALLQDKVTVAPVALGYRAAFSHSLIDGRAAAEYEPQGKAAQEVEQLYAWLMKQAKRPRANGKD